MAIFGKPPTRKTEKAKPGDAGTAREPQVMSARELAAHAASRKGKLPGLEPLGETSLRGASIIDWSTAPKAICSLAFTLKRILLPLLAAAEAGAA